MTAMADSMLLDPETAVSPAVHQLREQGRSMERTLSADIREEREELREAAEQTLNTIVDLGLDGIIRWVSPSWIDVIGTTPESVQGTAIRDLVVSESKDVFMDGVESVQQDDSRSRIVRFAVELGSASKLYPTSEPDDDNAQNEPAILQMEAQGIMVYDRSSGGESHTMWMLRPWIAPREVKIDLPALLVEALGSGAEVLAGYLTTLTDTQRDGSEQPCLPPPVLCRICERQIPSWWFEKHTELCLQEHKAEMEVQLAQESLIEHRHAIVKVLDALEARKARPAAGELNRPSPAAEYKSLPIGPSSSSSSSSGTVSPAPPPIRSRDPSQNRGHSRGRSFAIRRPQARIVELLLDLCDTAIEISTPAIKESVSQTLGEFRTQSPQSESRVSQVTQWQSPSTNTLEQEQGLALLCADSERVSKAKVDAVMRHRRIIEYAERIRIEFAVIVQDCIDEAFRKAAKIAAGELSSSQSETDDLEFEERQSEDQPEDPTPGGEDGFFSGSFDGPSSLARALREAESLREGRRMSPAVSTRSSSPKECPTPRSHGAASILGHSRDSRRESLMFESDTGAESDGSVRSLSVTSRPGRTESPVSEFGDLRRAASSRQRHRRSLILPGAMSPQRQGSPSRMGPPSSPLFISKPRSFPVNHDVLKSPIVSPLLSTSEFSSPVIVPHHHRRQSSVSVSDPSRPPLSPRLTAVNPAPQARAVAPSIKDFEIIKPISKGAFGSVYLAKKKSTGDYYAIKVLKKADMVAKNQVTNVKAERAIMMWQGESDFVAKLYWTFSSKDYLYLVMEYLNGGDCASLIKVLGGLPEDWAKKYLGEVILGVEHLHSRGIIHRDLKPDNLLIDQKGHLKLTDFGLSRMGLIGRQERVLNSGTTEPAPDLLKQGPFARSTSMASSRSTSFDYQGHLSPSLTPQMTPDLGGGGVPSYFSLAREASLPRENRRTSGQRSDSGGSDTLSSMFSSFSLNDLPPGQRRSAIDEASESDGNASPDLSLQPVTSHISVDLSGKAGLGQPNMMPPPMALFDPDDSNRRFVGTPDYLAPETVNGLGQDETSDWWSVGCILFEFLFGYPPFHDETPDKVFENILSRKISWPDEEDIDVSPEARDLIERLLNLDPQERFGANKDERYASGGEEICNHQWFEGTNWETLLEDEAQFVPAPENPEDTEYFDSRGATLQAFTEEIEDNSSEPKSTPSDYPERPHDALSKVRSQVNNLKRGLMPLHIPPHVRDSSRRRLSEPVVTDDFGNFAFKNLPVLERANKDVIQKLRAEALAAQSKKVEMSPTASATPSPVQPLEGSPIIPMPVQRTISNAKATNRPQSPSGLSQANSSPSRGSQPSSPLLVTFVTGQNNGQRKTSSASSSLSHQSASSLQPGGFFDVARPPAALKPSSAAVSPIKTRAPTPLAASPQKTTPRQPSNPAARSRSMTVGSQEGSPVPELFAHRKRRSQVFDMSPSSSDNEGDKASALLRVQRRRQSSRRLSQINFTDGPIFRPLDVLICEDHPVSRMVMEKLLEKLRCRTITVSNGAEAMRYAMSEIKFDIIMMEFKLPQISGADVARMIRDTKNANAHTPIVAITGYLKELQAPHYFDALIEKPPTTSKLTDVIARLCQWKAPTPGQSEIPLSAYPIPSGLRKESMRPEDSPTSASSGFPVLPAESFRGSSREDSISSSMFGDSESVLADDVPIVISRKATGDWEEAGLGVGLDDLPKGPPHLLTQESAPGSLEFYKAPIKEQSSEKLRAKRESIEKSRYECAAESGDDEDEELGDFAARDKSARQPSKKRGNSKLGIEMMRTNSRGSVIETPDVSQGEAEAASIPTHPMASATVAHLTVPPEFKTPAREISELDLDETPKPFHTSSPDIDEPTPRPLSTASNPPDYLSAAPVLRRTG